METVLSLKRTLPILAGAGLIVAAALIVPRLVQDEPGPRPKLLKLTWEPDPVNDNDPSVVVVLEQSSNMVNWTELARVRTSPVLVTADSPRMFYRAYRAWDGTPQGP